MIEDAIYLAITSPIDDRNDPNKKAATSARDRRDDVRAARARYGRTLCALARAQRSLHQSISEAES